MAVLCSNEQNLPNFKRIQIKNSMTSVIWCSAPMAESLTLLYTSLTWSDLGGERSKFFVAPNYNKSNIPIFLKIDYLSRVERRSSHGKNLLSHIDCDKLSYRGSLIPKMYGIIYLNVGEDKKSNLTAETSTSLPRRRKSSFSGRLDSKS